MINETELSKKTIFSFEVFPPKKTMPIDTIYSTLDELKDLKPDFISVTFGAGGNENCDNTLNIAKRIKESLSMMIGESIKVKFKTHDTYWTKDLGEECYYKNRDRILNLQFPVMR